MFYAVHDEDGQLVSWSSNRNGLADEEDLAERHLKVVAIKGDNAPPEGKIWNPKTLAFDLEVEVAEEPQASDRDAAIAAAREQFAAAQAALDAALALPQIVE